MSEVVSTDRLSSRQRWQVAWALTWPALLFDLLLWLVTVAVRRYLDEQSSKTIYNIYQVSFLFLIAPWIIRRTVRLNFPDFHLVAIRSPGGGDTRALSYRESLSVAWLFCWRIGAVGIVLFGAILLALWALQGAPPDRSQLSGLSAAPGFIVSLAGSLMSLLLFYLWLVSAAIRKTYSDFVIQLRETI